MLKRLLSKLTGNRQQIEHHLKNQYQVEENGLSFPLSLVDDSQLWALASWLEQLANFFIDDGGEIHLIGLITFIFKPEELHAQLDAAAGFLAFLGIIEGDTTREEKFTDLELLFCGDIFLQRAAAIEQTTHYPLRTLQGEM